MLRLTERGRAVLAEALRELAALIVGAFALGWFLGDARGSFVVPAMAMAAWVVLVGLAMAMTDGNAVD
jgi:hypothetical protein